MVHRSLAKTCAKFLFSTREIISFFSTRQLYMSIMTIYIILKFNVSLLHSKANFHSAKIFDTHKKVQISQELQCIVSLEKNKSSSAMRKKWDKNNSVPLTFILHMHSFNDNWNFSWECEWACLCVCGCVASEHNNFINFNRLSSNHFWQGNQ